MSLVKNKNPLVKTLAVLLIVAVVFFVGKNALAKTAVQSIVKKVTGLELKIRSLNIGLISTLIDIKGFRLMNPAGFKDRTMIDAPRIRVNYELKSLFSDTIHIEDMELDLKEFIVVRNENGDVNVNHLKPEPAQRAEKAPPAQKKEAKAKAKKEMPGMRIDVLRLKIGKVIYKDYSQGGKPAVEEFPVNLSEEHRNITNPGALTALVTTKALVNSGVARLAKVDVNDVLSALDGDVEEGLKAKAVEALKNFSDLLKK